MKYFRLILLIAPLLLGSLTHAQQKFAHINSNELLELMPERDKAQSDLEKYANTLESQLTSMSFEYEEKLADYQENSASWSSTLMELKVKEIKELEEKIQEFQSEAQENLANKESELLEPIITKAKTAIEKVSKELGYDYVIDSGVGVFLVLPESDDILPQVKKELGL